MAIDKPSSEKVEELLRKREIQESILQKQADVQTEALITLRRAARFFGFSEAKLREWDKSGLLSPERSQPNKEGSGPGQRQYSMTKLNKLAIMRVLLDTGYSINDIPPNIDEIWEEIVQNQLQTKGQAKALSIDQRVDKVYKEEFWRYYASHAMQLCLSLICGETSNMVAALILPLQQKGVAASVLNPEQLPELGASLVCFLSENHAFHTFYDSLPSFEYPTDFHVKGLMSAEEKEPRDRTYVVLQRKTNPVSLGSFAVNVIRRLLAPLYNIEASSWQKYLGEGFRDSVYSHVDFSRGTITDAVLNKLADVIVEMGGRTDDGKPLWKFCCMQLPSESLLPLYQRSLIVRAHSKDSPHRVGVTVHSQGSVVGLSIRAFQSGTIVQRRHIMRQGSDGSTIALWEREGEIHSAVALPIGGEDGLPIGAMYLASEKDNAFSDDDLRVLRMLARIAEERLRMFTVQRLFHRKLSDAIADPTVIDTFFTFFTDILTEGQFRSDVEELLDGILNSTSLVKDSNEHHRDDAEGVNEKTVSFISVDVDQQGQLANSYGDRMVHNLSLEVGIKIKDTLKALAKEYADCRVYHIYADRFYIMLDEVPLERARKIAEQLRLSLAGTYKLDALKVYPEQVTPSGRMLEIPSITVRLGVTSYLFTKLAEVLARYNKENAIDEVKTLILFGLETPLNLARDDGGNVVFSWEPTTRNYVRWSPR